MADIKEVFDRLAEPFPESQVRTRIQAGRELRYITARTARQRLNEVVGPGLWMCRVEPGPNWVKCSLTIIVVDDSGVEHEVTREALGGYPEMPKEEDRVKGGDSDAFKRACVLFGIGEHLYGDELHVEHAPASPRTALPPPPRRDRSFERDEMGSSYETAARPGPGPGPEGLTSAPSGARRRATWPRDGRQFYAWLKNMEQVYSWPSITKDVYTNFGPYSNYRFPSKYSEWNEEQVDAAATYIAQEATHKEAYQGEFDERLGRKAQ